MLLRRGHIKLIFRITVRMFSLLMEPFLVMAWILKLYIDDFLEEWKKAGEE